MEGATLEQSLDMPIIRTGAHSKYFSDKIESSSSSENAMTPFHKEACDPEGATYELPMLGGLEADSNHSDLNPTRLGGTEQTEHMEPNENQHSAQGSSTHPNVQGNSGNQVKNVREMISENAQQLIDDLNVKRKQDTQLLEDYKKAMDALTEKCYKIMENHLYQVYEQQNSIVQSKISELFSTLEHIADKEQELHQFKQGLGNLYQDVNAP